MGICVICGQATSRNRTKCRSCAIKESWDIKRRRNPINHCVDCGKAISHKALRCQRCEQKRRWVVGICSLDRCNIGKRGKESPNWKGGHSIDRHGYMRVYCPGHPRAEGNRVKEHILVWEQTHGKPLPKGSVIHHLNGIKADNRIRNLVALPSMKHSLVLAAKAKRIQELEAALNGTSPLL